MSGPDLHRLAREDRLTAMSQRLVDMLAPGFADRPCPDFHRRLVHLAGATATLAADDYARDKARRAVQWALIALEGGDNWRCADAESFALENASRLRRHVLGIAVAIAMGDLAPAALARGAT